MLYTITVLDLELFFFAGILAFGIYLWQIARKYHTVPGNLGFPIIGNVFQCVKNYWHTTYPDFYKYMDKYTVEYGDVTCFWLCHKAAVVVSDPALIEKIYEHPNFYNKPHFPFDRIGFFLKNVFVLAETDAEWKLRRKELVSHMKKRNLNDYCSQFIRTSNKAVDVLSEKPEVFNIKPQVSLLVLEAVCSTHFGIDVDLIDNITLYKETYMTAVLNVNNMINPISGNLTALLEGIFYPRTQKKFETMILDKVKCKAKELLNADNDQKFNMATTIALRNLLRKTSDADLQRELRELLYVSAHTSSFASTTSLMFLASNPDIQEKLWREQQDIFGDLDRNPTLDDIKKMEYLDRFVKESLRFAGPPITVREASGKMDFGGKIIPEGAMVFNNSLRMRFDPRYWENPKKFDPDRFLDVNIAKVPKGAYGAFGLGIRNCPGMGYANYFIKIFLSTIVRNLKLHSKTKPEDIKFKENIVMEMEGECNISVEKRLRRRSVN